MGGFLLLCLGGLLLASASFVAVPVFAALLWRPLGLVVNLVGTLVGILVFLVILVLLASTFVSGWSLLLGLLVMGWLASKALSR